jgi:hypothetical protein
MSDALSFAEIDGQHVELLPARTVLSMCGGCTGTSTTGTTSATGQGAPTGGAGGKGVGEAASWAFIYVENGNVTNETIGGNGGAGGAVNPAPTGG